MRTSPTSRRSTGSDTASATSEPARGRRLLSPLIPRVLAVNLLAMLIPAGGLLYLGHYRDELVRAEIGALAVEARVFASAVAEGATEESEEGATIETEGARQMIGRLGRTAETRTRLYGPEGRVIADSADMGDGTDRVRVAELPPGPAMGGPLGRIIKAARSFALDTPMDGDTPMMVEESATGPSIRADVVRALDGEETTRLWRVEDADGRLHPVLTVAAPVQRYRQIQGAVVLTRNGEAVEEALRAVRLDILRVFALTLAVTVLLSIYLAGTIARPIRRLAASADRLSRGRRLGRDVEIPDLTRRRDEIGDLSGVLRDMVSALRVRMEAMERFAADVAHEIKNPLTSLRSAVETAGLVDDPAKRAKLMAVISDDVRRLDRLISDISRASRLDAELNRAAPEAVDVGRLLSALAEFRGVPETGETGKAPPRVAIEIAASDNLVVAGLPGRLSQVFENLLANALSFSPPGGVVRLAARGDGERVLVTVTDEGPGLPEGKEAAIFERFYSKRPEGEKFGTHSGLGLSICRQIVDAHGGTIDARGRRSSDGRVLGAVFTVRLPRSGADA